MLNKLKQFKDLREQGKKMQSLLADESITVRAAGDKVVLTMNGNLELSAVVIDDELLTPDKKEKLQNAIKEAHADALKKMQRTIAMKMQKSGDFNIPGLS